MATLSSLLISGESFALSFVGYLKQVQSANKGLIGTEKQAQAAREKTSEANLIFSPRFFANGTAASDGKQSNPAILRYDRVEVENYSFGLMHQFSFGLQGRLYYQFTHTTYVDSTLPGFGAPENYYDANPTLELSMPLWGNGFGRSARAQRTLILHGNKAEEHASKAQAKEYEIEAENAYWTLVSTRETVKTQERALASAESILRYLRKKSRMRLGEDSDVLQARALVAARKLELREAVAEEMAARKNFNLQRGLISDNVPESLDPIPYQELKNLSAPIERPSDRHDLIAAHAQAESAVANTIVVAERNKPTLDIYGSYTLNGRSHESASDANSPLYGDKNGSQTVGVRLHIPLDLSSSQQTRSGARLAELAQRDQYAHKQLIQEKEWTLLRQSIRDAKESLELADELLIAQKAKLAQENVRFKQGRTTTYQVLLFEQDQSQAEIVRTQIAAQLLALRAGLKAYETGEAKKPR